MAEAIGLASGLLTLTTFAFKSSVALSDTVKSFQSHPKRVRELLDELETLSGALGSLTETTGAIDDIDFTALKLPLLRCGTACEEFKREIIKCSSRSGESQTSFRDWAKLKYLGGDIDGFRQLLSGYSLTITVAVADANLRKSSATAEGLQSYKELIATATGDLEDRLQGIDEKLEIVVGRTVEASDEDAAELRQIKEERTSTQKCLEICSRLSDQIDLIKLTPKRSGDPTEDTEPGSLPERVTNDGLQECKDSLAATAAKLEKYMQELIDRMIEKSKTGAHSTEDLADLARLRDEWLTTRQCRDICSKADNSLKGSVSVIDNYATGDAIQFMVSTNDKTIHGTNRGLGWKTRQVGGHLSDTTIQQLSRDMAGGAFRNSVHNDRSAHGQLSPIADDTVKEGPKSQFSDRYGPGLKLTHQTTPNVAMPSTNSGESRRNSPPGQ